MNKRMTLVEMLEQVIVEHNAEFNKTIKDATDHQNIAHTAVLVGLMSAIKVAKQHNEWINVDDCLPDERVKVLAWHSRKEKFFIATYDRELKVWLNDGKPYSSEFLYSITHWMSMPKIPNQGE